MKLLKRILSGALCLAVAAASCLIDISLAEADVPEGNYNEKSILSVSGSSLVSNGSSHYSVDETTGETSWNGYIQTNMDDDTLNSDYLVIKYEIEDGVSQDAAVINIQPFNTSWGGWDNNLVTPSDSDYDEQTGLYTYYIKTQKVISSLSSGTIYGINLSFNIENGVTLSDYLILSEEEVSSEDEYQLETQEFILNITGQDLVDAGYDEDALQTLISSNSGNVVFYVHISQANKYSWLQSRSGSVNSFNGNGTVYDDCGSGASNKYLTASDCTKQTSSNYPIQINSSGEPVGSAGTGNYRFPTNAITSSKITYVKNYSLTVAIKTSDTAAEVLGFVFSDGTSFTVNSDGSLTKGFTVPVCESTTLETDSGDGEVWEQTASEQRANLKLTLDYIASMDSSLYTADSWSALMTALASAQTVYDDASGSASTYKNARDTLENVKAKLIFNTVTDDSGALEFRTLDGDETVAEMGMGINLGNTLDGHSGFTPSETAWQSAITTKAYIKALHDAGYNTVRVPVTWGTMIDDENGYAINENWMNRVQQIVDYCIDEDMYVIINIHHDGAEQTGWLRVGADDIDSVMEKFEAVWRQIAERFKDYDEHLIFESMNEITCGATESTKNASDAVNYDTPIIVNFNQLFVNTVRSTGSNNTVRWLAVVSHYANNGSSSLFTLPEDTYNSDNRIMFAAHVYSDVDGMLSRLKAMANKFGKLGVPMYLGEYGRTNSTDAQSESGYNDPYRAYYCEVTHKACQVAGIVPVVWDQGFGDDEYQTGLYSYWNRTELRPIFKTITDAMARGTYIEPSSENYNWDFSDITYNVSYGVKTTEITSITPSQEEVELTIGDILDISASAQPSSTNDVLVWSVDNDKIATVFGGRIRAKGIGETTVHVSSLSGSVSVDIPVTVYASDSDTAAAITVDKESYTVTQGKGIDIIASADSGEKLTYESSNTDILTVNDLGRVYGLEIGTAYVVITAESGATKTVEVNVTDGQSSGEITLGLKVYYNDDSNSYWSVETGDTVTVTEEGTYTLSFDVDKDLSSAAKAAGISSISNLTAIYVKDELVDSGDAAVSALNSCNITYESIKVNGTELTLNSSAGPKSAIKSNGVFDTNDPVNAWDGSAVEEVTVSNHVANFTVSDPKTITVTFTLSDMDFKVTQSNRENEAAKISAITDKTVTICPNALTDYAYLTVMLDPNDTDTLTSFVSEDESIAFTELLADPTDSETGYVTAKVRLVKAEDVTVTAITENGLSVSFLITYAHNYAIESAQSASCTEDGWKHYVCSDCGDEYYETEEATGHSYVEVSRTEPQIGIDGEVVYECENCGDTYTEVLDALSDSSSSNPSGSGSVSSASDSSDSDSGTPSESSDASSSADSSSTSASASSSGSDEVPDTGSAAAAAAFLLSIASVFVIKRKNR